MLMENTFMCASYRQGSFQPSITGGGTGRSPNSRLSNLTINTSG